MTGRTAVAAHDPWSLGLNTARVAAHAQRHPAGDAELAVPAKGAEATDDVIARLDRLHLAADRADHAGRFVAGDGGQGMRIGAVDEVQVRMAQATGLSIDQDFVRQRIGEFDFANHQAFAGLFEDCGFGHQRVAPMSPELTDCRPA